MIFVMWFENGVITNPLYVIKFLQTLTITFELTVPYSVLASITCRPYSTPAMRISHLNTASSASNVRSV